MCFELPSWQPPSTSGNIIVKPSKHDRKVKKAVDSLKAEKEVQEAVKAARPKRGRISARFRDTIMKRDGEKCKRCGAKEGDLDENGEPVTLHIGHIIPVAQNGPTNDANCRVECSRCNLGAGARRDMLAVVPDPPPPKPALTPEAIKWQEEKAGEKKLIEIAELGREAKKKETK